MNLKGRTECKDNKEEETKLRTNCTVVSPFNKIFDNINIINTVVFDNLTIFSNNSNDNSALKEGTKVVISDVCSQKHKNVL